MSIPEGRVGNLTGEHEKILKQFWDKARDFTPHFYPTYPSLIAPFPVLVAG